MVDDEYNSSESENDFEDEIVFRTVLAVVEEERKKANRQYPKYRVNPYLKNRKLKGRFHTAVICNFFNI